MTVRRRSLLLGGAGLGLAGAAGASWALRPKRTDPRPNIVIVLTDDQGYDDVGCYADPTQEPVRGIRTPRLDRMAAEGVRLTDFYVAAPVCTPSRAALLTGCYPPRVGFGASGGPDDPGVLLPSSSVGLHPDEHTVADCLRSVGYATGMVGKWHLGHRKGLLPTSQGFDAFFGVPYSNNQRPLPLLRDETVLRWLPDEPDLTGQFTEAAMTFVTTQRERPFFLYLAYTAPHAPWQDGAWAGRTGAGPYADAIAHADDGVGQILDTLDRLRLSERTLVLFTSDNGPWLDPTVKAGAAGPFRGGKGDTAEGGMRSPCIVRWPGILPAGTVNRELMTALDVLPTVCGLGAAPLPPRVIDGLDVWETLSTGSPSARKSFAYYARGRLEAIRAGTYKRTFAVPDREPPVGAALYKVDDDPGERVDRSAVEPDTVARLEALAEPIRVACGDALLGITGAEVRPLGQGV